MLDRVSPPVNRMGENDGEQVYTVSNPDVSGNFENT
jgi:hypothetical protein